MEALKRTYPSQECTDARRGPRAEPPKAQVTKEGWPEWLEGTQKISLKQNKMRISRRKE